jgi:hypothetical protein
MTCTSLNTTAKTTDADQKAPFDPSARQIDSSGYSYVDFCAALNGTPDPRDFCNGLIAAYLKQGRSEAFCREFQKGYAEFLAEAKGPAIAAQLRRGDFVTPQAVRKAFDEWRPTFSDRRRIQEQAEKRAAAATEHPRPRFEVGAGTGPRAAIDFGAVDSSITTT